MAPEKAPAFQFYADKFLLDENQAVMTLQQVGAYARLMAYCWREVTIPDDPDKARVMVNDGKVTPRQFREMWPLIRACFTESDQPGRLRHTTLDKERAKQAAWRQKSANGGRHAQANRKGGPTTPEPPLQPTADILVSSLCTPVKDNPAPRRREPKVPGYTEAVKAYFDGVEQRLGFKPKFGKAEGALLAALVADRGLEDVSAAMRGFFADEWARDKGYTVGIFSSQYNKFLAAATAPNRKAGPSYNADDWFSECQHEPKCETGPMHRQRLEMDAFKGAA